MNIQDRPIPHLCRESCDVCVTYHEIACEERRRRHKAEAAHVAWDFCAIVGILGMFFLLVGLAEKFLTGG